MEHQDWNTIIIKKYKKSKSKSKSNPPTKKEKKHKIISHEFKTALIKARMLCGKTQRQLASNLNVSVKLIKGYENGTAIPLGIIISKLNRVLGIKLPTI